MTNLLVQLFLCVTIVQSQYLDDVFAAVTPGVEDIPGGDTLNQVGVTPVLEPIHRSANEIDQFEERGFNLFDAIKSINPFKPKSSSKKSSKPVVQSEFEKKYRERVASLKQFGDTLHRGFNETAKFLLLFVGDNSRSVLSFKNINDIKKVVGRAVDIASIGMTVLKNLLEDSNILFSTFTSGREGYNRVIKFVLSQVLKALPLPKLVVDMTQDAVNNVLKAL